MSKYLEQAVKSLRTPICEGRGIQVFRLKEMTIDTMNILDNLIDDLSVQQLISGIKRARAKGVSLKRVLADIKQYEDDANTALNPKEREAVRQAFRTGTW